MSMTNNNIIGKTVRTDFLIFDQNQELGAGEIKVSCIDEKLKEEDRARLGEMLKRQLHKRIKEAV